MKQLDRIMIMSETIVGILIAVLSGIILSLFLWPKDFVKNYMKRRDQIRYLVNLIVKYRDLILNARTIYVSNIDQEIKREEICKAYFEDMRRQVESALKDRASQLSYDEIEDVRGVFFTDLYPTVILNDKGYDVIFKKLESIKWLKLPPRKN